MNVSLSGDAQNYSVTTDENGEFSQEVEPGTYEIDGNAVEGTTYLLSREQVVKLLGRFAIRCSMHT